MKKSTVLIIVGIGTSGFLSGFVARKLTVPVIRPVSESMAATAPDTPVKTLPADVKSTSLGISTDTLKTLAALPHAELYSRLASWMIDASEQDIAAYWESYRTGKRSDAITGLVFLNWARLNPQAAIAATAGSEDAGFAWWGWSCYDPQGSLAAAIAAGPERVKDVARGLGEFHPAWLRRHFDEIPEAARDAALSGLAKFGDAGDPLEMIRFGQEHGMHFDESNFRAFVSKDPWAAFDWVKENRFGRFNNVRLDQFISQMAEERPDDLARLAAQAPSGEAKRMMETALFANLLKADPEAAIEQAKSIDNPRVAAERLAAVGLEFVKSDPGKAFEMAERLFAACPDAMMMRHSVQVPGPSGSAWGSSLAGVTDLMHSLMFQEPAKAMDIVAALPSSNPHDNYPFEELSDQWAKQDVTAYAEWLKRQTDPTIRSRGTSKVIGQLQKDGQYENAADWAMTVKEINRVSSVMSVTMNWAQKDRAKALEWLEAADLPAEGKTNIRNGIGQ